MAKIFLNGALPTDPDASPIYQDVRGLPPTMILIGENEVMLSDAIKLASHLGENRVRTQLEIWPGLFHAWPQYGPHLYETKQALDNICYFVNQFTL
jgi:monoterpene epsilon-lactone hydrolase